MPVEELNKIFDEHLLTEWFPRDINPVYNGEYECEFLLITWPWPCYRRCEWTGKTWKENGKKVKDDFKWRGLKEKAE